MDKSSYITSSVLQWLLWRDRELIKTRMIFLGRVCQLWFTSKHNPSLRCYLQPLVLTEFYLLYLIKLRGGGKIIFLARNYISLAKGAGRHPGEEGLFHCWPPRAGGLMIIRILWTRDLNRFHPSLEEFWVINNNVIKCWPQDGLIRPQFSTKARLLLRIQLKQSRLSVPISPPRPRDGPWKMPRWCALRVMLCAVRARPSVPINHHKHLKVQRNHEDWRAALILCYEQITQGSKITLNFIGK